MTCAVTAHELNELELMLVDYHHRHHANTAKTLARCPDEVCKKGRISIAWLREQLLFSELMLQERLAG